MKTLQSKTKSRELIIRGQPVSPGIAVGKAFILDDEYIETREEPVTEDNIQKEIDRFKKAIEETIFDLRLVMDQVRSRIDAVQRGIFDAHMMILEDRHIIDETIEMIKTKRINADHAYFTIMRNYQRSLDAAPDSYLRERASDIRDIKRRVIRKMQGLQRAPLGFLKNAVIVARELSVFDIRKLAKNQVAGVVLESGGFDSHIAIMVRSLELPGIFGAEGILKNIRVNDPVILNGLSGIVFINPAVTTYKRCERIRKNYRKFREDYLRVVRLPSRTRDKKHFEVNANITFTNEIDAVLSYKKFGIGLYRTELDFIESDSIPTEEELYDNYVNVVKKIHPHTVTIRTIDIGGDKPAPFIEMENEKNPFLGWRAIRICLDIPDLFKKQLRAIFRASVWGKIRLMFPMITTTDEIRRVKDIVQEVMADLRRQNIEYDPTIPIGIMIEVPSAAILADHLAREVDFFSIGTNDLIQYSLAVDRSNAKVSKYYNSFDPSIIRLIKMTVEASKKYNISVGLCGEMAGDPLASILLLGLGITEFSVSPIILPRVKQVLRSLDYSEAQKISKKCLRMQTAEEITEYLRKKMTDIFPKMDEDDFFHRQKI